MCLNWLNRIKCQNIIKLWGNHTSNTYRLYKAEVFKQYGLSDVEIYPIRMGNVTFVGNHADILVGKQLIVMNHFPLHIFRNAQRGTMNISGHSHNMDVSRNPEHPQGKTLDVSWDYFRNVWSFGELIDVMSTKEINILDHRR